MNNNTTRNGQYTSVTTPLTTSQQQTDLTQLRLNKLKEEEQFAMKVASQQLGEQSRLARIRLEHIKKEQQEILRQLMQRQSGTGSSVLPQTNRTKVESVYQPKQRTSSFINANFGNNRKNGSLVQTPIKSNFAQPQFRSEQNNSLEPVNTERVTKISEKRQRKSTTNWVNASFGKNQTVYKANFAKQPQPTVHHVSNQITENQKSYNALSDKLGRVINDPELKLGNYETFYDKEGNKHLRYVVKQSLTQTQPTSNNNRNPPIPQTKKAQSTIKTIQERSQLKDKAIEHKTFDKDGNPVKIYTTIDENGLPLQIINLIVKGNDIQYVSYINDSGQQTVVLLQDFLDQRNYSNKEPEPVVESLRREQQSLSQSNTGVPSRREIKDMLINTFSNRQSEVREMLEQVPSEREVLDIIRNSERQGEKKEQQQPELVSETRSGTDQYMRDIKARNNQLARQQEQREETRTNTHSQSTTIVKNRVDFSNVSSSRNYENSNTFLKENKKFEENKESSFVISGLKVTRKSVSRRNLRKWSHREVIGEEPEITKPIQSSRVIVAKTSESQPVKKQVTRIERTPQRTSTYTNRVYSKSVAARSKRRFKLDEM